MVGCRLRPGSTLASPSSSTPPAPCPTHCTGWRQPERNRCTETAAPICGLARSGDGCRVVPSRVVRHGRLTVPGGAWWGARARPLGPTRPPARCASSRSRIVVRPIVARFRPMVGRPAVRPRVVLVARFGRPLDPASTSSSDSPGSVRAACSPSAAACSRAHAASASTARTSSSASAFSAWSASLPLRRTSAPGARPRPGARRSGPLRGWRGPRPVRWPSGRPARQRRSPRS
jgi:hypothetical protein